jgi:hypothetical protein
MLRGLAERDVFDFGGAHCDRIVAKVLARLPYAEAYSCNLDIMSWPTVRGQADL